MSAFIIDSNVAVVANGKNTHASYQCQLTCIEKLECVIQNGLILIDDGGSIFEEYHRRLDFSGAPGVGDMFYKHVFDHQYNPERVQRVPIHPTDDGSFAEFPCDSGLVGFDLDDHRFVAVAMTSGISPTILNAVDTDWANYHQQFIALGLVIDYLCPEHVIPDTDD